MLSKMSNTIGLLLVATLIVGCSGLNGGGKSSSAGPNAVRDDGTPKSNKETIQSVPETSINLNELLSPANDNADIRVNKYLWEASLETLNFLPIEAADPFSGILVMGWGRAPGSATDFRATILIQDPALEAGSLKVAMQKRKGPASAETNRLIEDAILTRARQLRIRAAKRR